MKISFRKKNLIIVNEFFHLFDNSRSNMIDIKSANVKNMNMLFNFELGEPLTRMFKYNQHSLNNP